MGEKWSERALAGDAGTARIARIGGPLFAEERHPQEFADLGPHWDDRGRADSKLGHGAGGRGKFAVERRALGERETRPGGGEGRGVFEELAELGDGAGGDQGQGVAKGAPARVFGADGVNVDVFEAEGLDHVPQQAGPLLEGLDQVDAGLRTDDRDHEAGIAAARSHVGDRGKRTAVGFLGDAQDLERLCVVAARCVLGGDCGRAGAVPSGFEQGEMADEEGKPAFRLGEGGEEAREVVPGERQRVLRGAITRWVLSSHT